MEPCGLMPILLALLWMLAFVGLQIVANIKRG